jgi:hypothetical protein
MQMMKIKDDAFESNKSDLLRIKIDKKMRSFKLLKPGPL